MLRYALTLFTLTACIARPAAAACASGESVAVWSCYEITLASDQTYAHPINGIRIQATFSQDGSVPVRVLGFWDGGTTYRVRAALPDPGVWTYAVSTDDPQNAINGTAGSVTVTPYAGDDPFRQHGWLRTSADQRSLTYADQTPFFWLADTAWEMIWAALPGQVGAYAADRHQKGFNVIQVVANSHQYFYPWHIRNNGGDGDPYLLNNDHTMLNPAYFARMDEIVDSLNAEGLAVAIAPIWGTYGRPHFSDPDNGHQDSYSLDDARIHARYVGARYAGANVVWFVGGDRDYFTEEKRAYWDAFARELKAASGGTHLMAVHSGGYSGSYNSWPVPPDWMSFHMYQAGHYSDLRYTLDDQGNRVQDAFGALRGNGDYHWEGGLIGYHQAVHIPVLNVEANYEDIIGRFWDFFGTDGGERVEAVHVRNAAYWGLLSGSGVGYSYGANGVWQWTNELEPNGGGGFRVRHTVMEALTMPASSQMAAVRAFAEAHRWYEWVPAPELVQEIDTDHFVAASVWNDRLLVYAPQGSRTFTAQMPDTTVQRVDVAWTSPTTGVVVRQMVAGARGLVTLGAPTAADWLAELRPAPSSTVPPEPEPVTVRVRTEGTNPARSVRALLVSGPPDVPYRVEVVDALGRRVASETLLLSAAPARVALPTLAPGVYVCRVSAGASAPTVLRFTVTG